MSAVRQLIVQSCNGDADLLHTLCLHMYSVFRGTEEYDLRVMLLHIESKGFPIGVHAISLYNRKAHVKTLLSIS
jgi:hypothetical protein